MHKQDNIKDGRKTTSEDNPYIMNIIRMPRMENREPIKTSD